MIRNLLPYNLCILLSLYGEKITNSYASGPNMGTILGIAPKLTEDLYEEILSEINVFYVPGTNESVPLLIKSMPGSETPKTYGFLPCTCTQELCSCCVGIKLKPIKFEENGCVNLRLVANDVTSLETELKLSNFVLFTRRIAFDHTPPFCYPLPPFPPILICTTFTDIKREGRNIKACVNFDIRFIGMLEPLWTLKFTCVSFGFDGVSFFAPPTMMVIEGQPAPAPVYMNTFNEIMNVDNLPQQQREYMDFLHINRPNLLNVTKKKLNA